MSTLTVQGAAVAVRRCGCGVPLSRYNPADQCATCQTPAVVFAPVLPSVRVVLPDVGALIRAWRAEHRMSQAQVAVLLGYDQSFLSMVERGRRQVRDIEALARIAARLGLAPEAVGVASAVLARDVAGVA